jgi:hypothetical protein
VRNVRDVRREGIISVRGCGLGVVRKRCRMHRGRCRRGLIIRRLGVIGEFCLWDLRWDRGEEIDERQVA